MKGIDFSGQDYERMASSIEHERWTNAILRALHELRCASASGLDKHFCDEPDGGGRCAFVSPLAGSIQSSEPRTTH
jgi:hypothetical protein